MTSSSDTHFVRIGDQLTACLRPATGKGGVFLRSDNPKRITCTECRAIAGIRGPIDEGSAHIADAGRQLDRAILAYGSIGLHPVQVPKGRKRRGK